MEAHVKYGRGPQSELPSILSMVWEATNPDTTKYFLLLSREEPLEPTSLIPIQPEGRWVDCGYRRRRLSQDDVQAETMCLIYKGKGDNPDIWYPSQVLRYQSWGGSAINWSDYTGKHTICLSFLWTLGLDEGVYLFRWNEIKKRNYRDAFVCFIQNLECPKPLSLDIASWGSKG
jgi:hypothetical protein